ncbi:MAG: hypothetical protein K2Z81_02820, partial [Cyanobacteria bacterium]|nr:hypothetical protein [Cyanobacteriota bacterium]
KLPSWSRVLIAFVSVGMLTILGGITSLTLSVKRTFENAQNPAFIARVARQIALFPNPLPKDYSYYVGLDLRLFSMVAINYKNDRQQLMFIGINNSPQPETSPDGAESLQDSAKVLRKACELGVTTLSTQSRFRQINSKGAWLIADQRIPYITGELEDVKGTGLIGCNLNRRTGRTLLLYAVQPGDGKFETRVVTDLLQYIRAF